MANLSSDEAARRLGISPEQLLEQRQSGKISGMRDGSNWLFKEPEVERYAEALKNDGGASSLSGPSLELGEPDSILLSEQELGKSAETTSSTIIGSKHKKPAAGGESDIHLASSSPPPIKRKPDSDLALAAMSDINLSPSDSGKKFEELEDFSSIEPEASGIQLASSDSDKHAAGSSELNLADELKPGSTGKLKKDAGGSSVKLSDDDELVLGGSGSDVTLGTGDSGIGLSSPSDSGLNLEEPLELGGSKVEMMELGEDDVVSLEEDADLESATQLKADDEFLLTPSAGADDSSDSGSQVIALEGDEEFAPIGMGGGMLVEDAGMGGLAAMGAMQPGAQVIYAPAVPEMPYSIWNVLALFMCILFLLVTGMFMYDLLRNMWSWDQPYEVNSKMMDAVLKWFEK